MIDKLIKLCELKDELDANIALSERLSLLDTKYLPCNLWYSDGDNLFTYSDLVVMRIYNGVKVVFVSEEYTVFKVKNNESENLIILSTSKDRTS
jgi:hypothetical protein